MALQTNLRDEDVNAMKKAFEKNVLPENPEARFQSFNMSAMNEALRKSKDENEMLQEISDRLDRLEKLIKLTFDGHVLIDGQFKKISV